MTFNEAAKPTLHLFRSLLRAATYLPDPAARSYFHDYIIKRFREVTPATPEHLRKARQSLGILERASHGEERSLKKVIFMTYGRRGKRRRELLEELQKIDEEELPSDSDALKSTIAAFRQGEAVDPSRRNLKVLALVQSQRIIHSEEIPRPLIKQLKPRIPKENLWGNPVPLKRQKSIVRKWWGAEVLNRILPPLPEHEWNRLRDLASGRIAFEGLLPRRRSHTGVSKVQGPSDLDYWTKPIRKAHEHDTIERFRKSERHHLTASHMQRLWGVTWKISPLMSKDKDTGQWKVTWGQLQSRLAKGEISPATKSDMELFKDAPFLRLDKKLNPRR